MGVSHLLLSGNTIKDIRKCRNRSRQFEGEQSCKDLMDCGMKAETTIEAHKLATKLRCAKAFCVIVRTNVIDKNAFECDTTDNFLCNYVRINKDFL